MKPDCASFPNLRALLMAGITCILFSVPLISYTQDTGENRHSVGLGVGSGIPWEDGSYIDFGNYTSWPDNHLTTVFSLFYDYRINPYLTAGAHIDLETGKADVSYPISEETSTTRLALGLHWLAMYPNQRLQAQLGGYFNYGTLMADDFDNTPGGFEYGIIAGPAFKMKQYTLALHMMPGFSYLFTSGSPSAVLIFYPRVMLKCSYTF